MAIYGAEVIGNTSGNNTMAQYEYLVKANTTVYKGDLVKIAAGYVEPADDGAKIFGVAQFTVVQGATPTEKVLVTLAGPGTIVRIDGDETMDISDEGKYFHMVETAGQMTIDSSTAHASAGPLFCIKWNPTGRDASQGDYVIAESMLDDYAASA